MDYCTAVKNKIEQRVSATLNLIKVQQSKNNSFPRKYIEHDSIYVKFTSMYANVML